MCELMDDNGAVNASKADEAAKEKHAHNLDPFFQRPLKLPQWVNGQREDYKVRQHVAGSKYSTGDVCIHAPVVFKWIPVGSHGEALDDGSEGLNAAVAKCEDTNPPEGSREVSAYGEDSVVEVQN